MSHIDEDGKQWWLSVRDQPEFNGVMRRHCDVLYGLVVLFQFSKTHAKLERDRFTAKRHKGLKTKGYRLSHRIAMPGGRVSLYFKKWPDTVKGKLARAKRPLKVRQHKERHYGRRHELIISPRLERHCRKYGPLGG